METDNLINASTEIALVKEKPHYVVQESVLTTSEDVSVIAKALAKAQGEIGNAEKDGSNPHFRSTYATLASSIQTGKPAATANGLAVLQANSFDGTFVILMTLILHESNQWIKNIMKLPCQKQDIHTIKSIVTYARRMAYNGLLCIAEDDDDGNAGVGKPVAIEDETQMKEAKKLRAKINKDFGRCLKMSKLEKLARDYSKGHHNFWSEHTFNNPKETFGDIYLTHKSRVATIEEMYTEEGQEKWRGLLLKSDKPGDFYNMWEAFKDDIDRQTNENEQALFTLAQDLGLWDNNSQSIMELEK